ncbi:MAG: hypothetical protein BGP05_01590 [Rhizobiales bacterium 62-47]|nr:MAG: hypothetical protein BGP05_01590 [Rhizobiales bacterium 62-47]
MLPQPAAATDSMLMLPGFRFLFAAVVLTISTVIFGLGAAALLRASHDQFASMPAWRAPPETVFAQQPDTAPPTLALLHVDAAPEKSMTAPEPAKVPAPEPQSVAPPAEPAKTVEAPAAPPDVTTSAASAPSIQPAPDQADTGRVAAVRDTEAVKAVEPSDATVTPSVPEPDAKPVQVAALPTRPEPAAAPPPVATPAAPSIQIQAEAPAPVTATPDAKPATESVVAVEPRAEIAKEPSPAQPAETPIVANERTTPAAAPSPTEADAAAATLPASSTPDVPVDAPIRTAMLNQETPEPVAELPPPVSIEGPIPLPRSRAIALAKDQPRLVAQRRKVAARVVRPRPVRRATPAAAAPAQAPNGLFPLQ